MSKEPTTPPAAAPVNPLAAAASPPADAAPEATLGNKVSVTLKERKVFFLGSTPFKKDVPVMVTPDVADYLANKTVQQTVIKGGESYTEQIPMFEIGAGKRRR